MSTYAMKLMAAMVVSGLSVGMMSGAAAACSVNIEVTGETTVPAGAEPLALGAKTSDCKKTTFQWNVKGVGSLDEPTEQTLFYTPPSTIEGNKKQAIISVTVTEADGNEASDSVTLTIVRGDIPPNPTPEPTVSSTPEEKRELIFSEDFEKGIQKNKGWEKDGNKIEVVDCGQEYGKCVKVSRTSPAAWTSLRKKFTRLSGTLIFEAMVKVESIVPGEKEWHRARFDTEISKPGEEQKRYPGHYYGEPFDWTLERFEADYLDGTETVELMISVLYTKGTIYVDNIKVYHRP